MCVKVFCLCFWRKYFARYKILGWQILGLFQYYKGVVLPCPYTNLHGTAYCIPRLYGIQQLHRPSFIDQNIIMWCMTVLVSISLFTNSIMCVISESVSIEYISSSFWIFSGFCACLVNFYLDASHCEIYGGLLHSFKYFWTFFLECSYINWK